MAPKLHFSLIIKYAIQRFFSASTNYGCNFIQRVQIPLNCNKVAARYS